MKMVVKLEKLVQEMNLKNLTPDVSYSEIELTAPDINRPALQLAGFFEHFASERVQVVGYVEYKYLQTVPEERRAQIYDAILSYPVPCFIFCRSGGDGLEENEVNGNTDNIRPDAMFLEKAKLNNIPVFSTEKPTSTFMSEVIRWLNVELAPRRTIHGVFVDVYGVGVLIKGDSGIGKSETALELIKRGHRLVSDDAVEIHKIGKDELIGHSPEITKHLIELRGIGIIDVKNLFGVQSVRNKKHIDLVIILEEWNKDKVYDRLGLEDEYDNVMEEDVVNPTMKVCHRIPVKPGRNLALIVESAAINYKQKRMGYNAAQELMRRITLQR